MNGGLALPAPALRRPVIAATATHWCMSVDFPEPEIPVRTVSLPSGMDAVRFFRLFAVHSVSVRNGCVFFTSRRPPRVGWRIGFVSARYVGDFEFFFSLRA